MNILDFNKEEEKVKYLKKFTKQVLPEAWSENEEIKNKVMPIGDEIIKVLESQELTYVDAYVILEYVYRMLKFKSEYTHL